MKVYVAGASSEMERAETWMRKLRGVGIIVTSTWPEVIRSVGKANPRDATIAECKEWVMKDLGEIDAADVLWLLLPDLSTIGAWIELGFAHARNKMIVTSGLHRPIFTPGLSNAHNKDDEQIFATLSGIRNLTSSEILELR